MSRDRATYLKFKPMADDLRKAESWSEPDGVLNRNKTMQNLYKIGYRKQEWISVDERLPAEKVNCLVHYKHAYCDNDGYWALGLSFYDGHEFHIGLAYKVTHWMPLPEAPKI